MTYFKPVGWRLRWSVRIQKIEAGKDVADGQGREGRVIRLIGLGGGIV